jgi:hypothetical protein
MKITRHRRQGVLTPTPKHTWIMNLMRHRRGRVLKIPKKDIN